MGNTNQIEAIKSFEEKLQTLNMKEMDIKLKKQKSYNLRNFTYTVNNKVYCLTDNSLKIYDFVTRLIVTNEELYNIWDPQGHPFYVSSSSKYKEIYSIDEQGLLLINFEKLLVYRLDQNLDCGDLGGLDKISGVVDQEILEFYLRKFQGEIFVYRILRLNNSVIRTERVLSVSHKKYQSKYKQAGQEPTSLPIPRIKHIQQLHQHTGATGRPEQRYEWSPGSRRMQLQVPRLHARHAHSHALAASPPRQTLPELQSLVVATAPMLACAAVTYRT